MPFVDFSDGQVLTGAQTDILMRQGIMRFADAATMGTDLSGDEEEGMHTYTEDLGVLWVYQDGAFREQIGPWLAYTPAWTNLTVGSSTVTARRRYVGDTIEMRGQITMGSGFSIGGAVTQTIPDSRTADAAPSEGTATFFDAGVFFGGWARVAPGGTVVTFLSATGTVNTTVPFTWASGDVLSWHIKVGLVAA